MNDDARARFLALLEAHAGIVLKIAGSYTRHFDDRADLVQEINAQLWRAFGSYDSARPFATWMYRVARNVAISSLRSDAERWRRVVPLDEARHVVADPHAGNPDAEQRVAALARFIGNEPPLHRALLLLYLDEHSYREIAEILGISETNVATKIHRLKQRMRDEI